MTEQRQSADWNLYKACKTCGAESQKPCMHTTLITTKGKPVYLDAPHWRRSLLPREPKEEV